MGAGSDEGTSGGGAVSVFLSYSREDRATAVALVDALEAQGFAVWWDGLIEGGRSFADSIESALASADAVVVLWSAHSVRSHWVRDEAAQGRDGGRLVPVLIDGTEPPLGFRQVQCVELGKSAGKTGARELEALFRAVRAAAGAPQTRTEHRAAPLRAAIPRRRALALGGAGVAALGLGFVGWAGLGGGGLRSNSIVVLPFRNMSNDPGQDYFSEGLSEELRATLSRNGRLEVAAGTSSAKAVERSPDARAIAAALDVAFLLQGSVRRAGDMLRISAQLVDGSTGFDKWAQSFDRPAADILGIQSEVATFVTDALLAGIFSDSEPAKRLGGTRNAAAFDAFLRGSALYKQAGGEADDRAALAEFDKAVAADLKYAAAHAARSRVLTVIANNHASHHEIRSYYQRSVAAARDAIRLAPDLAEGHSALGFVLFNGQLDARAARAPYQKSFELGFGNSDILSAYANYAARIGEFADGRKAIARAQRLDPLNQTVFRNAGLLEFAARDYDSAMAPLSTALSLNPKTSIVHSTLGDIALLNGNFAEALAEYRREPDSVSRLRGVAIAEMRLSRPGAANAALAELLREHGDVSLYQQAQVLSQWGRRDAALATLEKAVLAGDAGLVRLRNDPMLDPIRNDVRFVAVQRRLGFE